jgi:hypothetical protein
MLTQVAVRVWRGLPGWARGALTWCVNAHFVVGTVALIEDDDGHSSRPPYLPATHTVGTARWLGTAW